MSGIEIGSGGIGYRATCRCADKTCRQILTVLPETRVIRFEDQAGHPHLFYPEAEEANALAEALTQLAQKR